MSDEAIRRQSQVRSLQRLGLGSKSPLCRVSTIVPDVSRPEVAEVVLRREALLVQYGLDLPMNLRFGYGEAVCGPSAAHKTTTLQAFDSVMGEMLPDWKYRGRPPLETTTLRLKTTRKPRTKAEREGSPEYSFITRGQAERLIRKDMERRATGRQAAIVFAVYFCGQWYILETVEFVAALQRRVPILFPCCLEMAIFLKLIIPTLDVRMVISEGLLVTVPETFIEPRKGQVLEEYWWRYAHGTQSIVAAVEDVEAGVPVPLVDAFQFIEYTDDLKERTAIALATHLDVMGSLQLMRDVEAQWTRRFDAVIAERFRRLRSQYRQFLLDNRKEIVRQAAADRVMCPELNPLRWTKDLSVLEEGWGDLKYACVGPGVMIY